MHPEGNSGGSEINRRFSSWLRSGSQRKLNHAGNLSLGKQTKLPDFNYHSENDDEEPATRTRNRKLSVSSIPPIVALPPASELLIEYSDGIPTIKIADLSATPQDVIDRMNFQENRISEKPTDQRTPVEQKWIQKRINNKI